MEAERFDHEVKIECTLTGTVGLTVVGRSARPRRWAPLRHV